MKISALFGILLSLNFYVLADIEDGVAVLSDDPTEAQIQKVRDGAEERCRAIEDGNQREVCVMDYYAQHNLEEEPSCD